jgi:uncharacterized protein YjbJ (UPF0337 family)
LADHETHLSLPAVDEDGNLRSRSAASAAEITHDLGCAFARISYMKSSTKDKIKGNIQQAKGAVKEKLGRASGDPEMEDTGTAEKVGGKIRDKVGDIKKVFEK